MIVLQHNLRTGRGHALHEFWGQDYLPATSHLLGNDVAVRIDGNQMLAARDAATVKNVLLRLAANGLAGVGLKACGGFGALLWSRRK
jgi:hypothetical protein